MTSDRAPTRPHRNRSGHRDAPTPRRSHENYTATISQRTGGHDQGIQAKRPSKYLRNACPHVRVYAALP
jgi:hypothetical protein